MDADSPYVQNARYTSTVGKSAVKWKQNVTMKAIRKILQYLAFYTRREVNLKMMSYYYI